VAAVHARLIPVQGIIIRRSPLGEYDQIFTFYTYQLGKIRVSARGSLRPKNQWRGHLEPFYQLEAELYQTDKSTLYRFNNVEVIGRPSNFLSHLTALHTAYLVIECLDRYCEVESPNPDLYQAAIDALGSINRDPDQAGYHVRCFCLRFFLLSGYSLHLSRCVQCNRERPSDRRAYCITSAGGIVCSQCLLPEQKSSEWIIDADVLQIAADASQGQSAPPKDLSPDQVERFNTSIYRVIRETFAHYLDGVPNSLMMLNSL